MYMHRPCTDTQAVLDRDLARCPSGQSGSSGAGCTEWRSQFRAAKQTLQSLTPRPQAPRYDMPVDIWTQSTINADPLMREWVLDGIVDGFDIHVVDHPALPRTDVPNLPMTIGQKLRFTQWAIDQHGTGACWGPFAPDGSDVPDQLKGYRVHPQGMVRKGNHFGVADKDKKWRPINHLSHPRGEICTNSQVKPEWATVTYMQFKEIVELAEFAGPHAKIWAVDAKDAFLRVPVKIACMRFMAFKWACTLWFFTSLCFGLSSAPRIYTLFADMILWIIMHTPLPGAEPTEWHYEGRQLVHHYVDDFFGFVPRRSGICAWSQFQHTISWFARLGVPTTPEKTLEPSTKQVILGFLYDTVRQMVFIPPLKCQAYTAAIDRLLTNRSVTKQEVLSLIGKLRWASACVFAGPAFLRRMEHAAHAAPTLTHMVRTRPMRKDLIWWRAQIQRAAVGIPFKHILANSADGEVQVLTDASTGLGMGGWSPTSGDWFRFKWSQSQRTDIFSPETGKAPDIFWKELCGVVTAALLWGHQWQGKTVTFQCDNMSTVWTIIKKSCTLKRPDIMHLVRILMDTANAHGFHPFIVHIKGEDNITADALSRFMARKFWEDTEGTVMATRESPSAWACEAIVSSHWLMRPSGPRSKTTRSPSQKKHRGRKRRFCEL